jgi:hypothetical protein
MSRARAGAVSAALMMLAIACNQPAGGPAAAHSSQSPETAAGGCAGTVLTNAEPPQWAQSGWTVTKGSAWPVPWTSDASGDAVAFVFATKLVAGASPRVDGSANKVLWVLREAGPFVVEGRPAGQSAPVVTVPGGPSIVDVPTPGCWTFRLIPNDRSRVSTISLEALPHGSRPN